MMHHDKDVSAENQDPFSLASVHTAEMAVSEDQLPLPRLPELFETSEKLLDEVEMATQPTGSGIIQEKVFKGLGLLQKAAEMLSQLHLFEEIASADLKYLKVPAFQAALTVKQVNPSKRLDHLQWAREHFVNYLTQCQAYKVAEFQLPQTMSSSAESSRASSSVAYPNLIATASQRQAKIERYKQKKEVEHRLKPAVESAQADDERVREYHLLHLRRWIAISLEEIESIDQELKILREKDSSREESASRSSLPEKPPMKPFILTRSKAQAKVFGAGYPSLAAMTVSDWYEQHQKYGALPGQGIAKPTSADFKRAARQQEDEEQKEEESDEKTLHRMREWDGWKDCHPRGYGNWQNMG